MTQMRIAATVPVNLGDRSYDITIGSGLLLVQGCCLAVHLNDTNFP